MPRCVPASRIAESGGDVSELDRGLDSSQIVLGQLWRSSRDVPTLVSGMYALCVMNMLLIELIY